MPQVKSFCINYLCLKQKDILGNLLSNDTSLFEKFLAPHVWDDKNSFAYHHRTILYIMSYNDPFDMIYWPSIICCLALNLMISGLGISIKG